MGGSVRVARASEGCGVRDPGFKSRSAMGRAGGKGSAVDEVEPVRRSEREVVARRILEARRRTQDDLESGADELARRDECDVHVGSESYV